MTCKSCSGGSASKVVATRNGRRREQASACSCGRSPFIPSCETQEALAGCIKQVFCDVIRCLGDAAKDFVEKDPPKNPLVGCVVTAAVSFAECVPDALCGARAQPVVDQLPCDFAVEEQLALSDGSEHV